jgi:ElaB/YqjD/DUF883 family membrane-anchored ribosome-binding protein
MKHIDDNAIQQEIDDLKKTIKDLKELFIQKIAVTAYKGEERILQQLEEKPMQSVGLAAAVGFILGAIFTSRIK